MKLLFIFPRLGQRGVDTGSMVIFKKFINQLPKEDIVLLSISDYKQRKSDWTSKYKYYSFYSLLFHPFVVKAFKKTFFRSFFFIFERTIYPYFVNKKITKIIRTEKIDKLWVYACPDTIPVLKRIFRKKRIPYHLSIHDDMLENDYFKNKCSKYIKKDLLFLLKNYSSCDLISPYMKEYYIQKYNLCLDAFNIWSGFTQTNNIGQVQINKKIKKIAYIGSMGRQEEPEAFWKAIDIINKERSEQDKIEIHYYINAFNQKRLNKKYTNIIYKGLIPNKDVQSILANYDLLYLTMSFAPDWAIVSKVSFPSKTMAYLESGIPIITHGPDYSTIIRFAKRYKIGLPICTLDSNKFANSVLEYEKNIQLREKHSENIKNLVNSELSFNKNFPTLKKLIYSK